MTSWDFKLELTPNKFSLRGSKSIIFYYQEELVTEKKNVVIKVVNMSRYSPFLV